MYQVHCLWCQISRGMKRLHSCLFLCIDCSFVSWSWKWVCYRQNSRLLLQSLHLSCCSASWWSETSPITRLEMGSSATTRANTGRRGGSVGNCWQSSHSWITGCLTRVRSPVTSCCWPVGLWVLWYRAAAGCRTRAPGRGPSCRHWPPPATTTGVSSWETRCMWSVGCCQSEGDWVSGEVWPDAASVVSSVWPATPSVWPLRHQLWPYGVCDRWLWCW